VAVSRDRRRASDNAAEATRFSAGSGRSDSRIAGNNCRPGRSAGYFKTLVSVTPQTRQTMNFVITEMNKAAAAKTPTKPMNAVMKINTPGAFWRNRK
jgi:hypothetical protein